MKQIMVDVEACGDLLETIPLEQAVDEYILDEADVEKIKSGETLFQWFGALSLHEED